MVLWNINGDLGCHQLPVGLQHGLDVSQRCDEMKLWDGSWDTCTCGEGGDDGLAWASRVNRNVSDYGDDGDCVNEEMRSNSSSNPQMSN